MIGDTHRRRVAERLFIQSGVVWQLGTQGYWLLFFVRLVVDVDLNPLELVLLGTAKEITVLSSEIPTGVIADLYSRKWSVVLAFLISGTAIILAGILDTFLLLLISSALWGFGLTFRSGAETAWLTDELGSSGTAEPIIVRRAKIELVAVIFGALAAAGLATITSLSTSLIVLGSALVAEGVYLAVAMPETGFVRAKQRKAAELQQILGEGFRSVRRVSPLRILFIATVMAGFGSEAVDRLYVRRLDDLSAVVWTGREVLVVGIILIAQSLGAALLLRTFGRRLQGRVLIPALSLLMLGTALGVLLLARIDL
ncbi:MAG: MFS transporter, partial [Acidimicrobiia bacterium]|nr:MFS transporter [Acidimicrobiia bacterium]